MNLMTPTLTKTGGNAIEIEVKSAQTLCYLLVAAIVHPELVTLCCIKHDLYRPHDQWEDLRRMT